MWLWLALISALLLGLYDVAKKHALNRNAVVPVLLIATACGSVVVLPLIALSFFFPDSFSHSRFFIPPMPPHWHALLALKGLLVTFSWVLAYFSLKHLPISIVSPIRASAPAWTIAGAVLLFGESPTGMQWCGLAVIFASYYCFSIIGLKEGIVFHKNPWILSIVIATLAGSLSALYDKYLLQKVGITPLVLQAWFSVYLLLFQGALLLVFRHPAFRAHTQLIWRWSIPAIGLLLIAADLVYFKALHDPEALIALVSPVRRTSAVVSFLIGGALFVEKNKRWKALPLIGVLAGVFMVILG